LKRYSSLFILPFLFSTLNSSDEMISQNKKDILNYSYQKALEDSGKLKKDWINPITYQYIYNDGEEYTTQRSYISISQPIFKSGGIYSAIKYADSIEKYSKTSIDTQKKEIVKQIIDLTYQINKLDITIKKQQLLIQNGKLDIDRKKEQVLSGLLDTSFLDNAILDSNIKQNALIDLEYQKTTLINNLAKISSKTYDKIDLPKLSLIDQDSFIEKNIYMKQSKEDIDSSYWVSRMTTANYLPTVNLTANYTKYHDTDNKQGLSEDGTTNVGFNITIPLDIKYSNTIESSKIAYLQKKSTLEDTKIEQLNDYRSAIAKVDSLKEKIKIAQSDIELYDSLLVQMIEQKNVGMKTDSDVQTMENSKKIKSLDLISLGFDEQLALLDIYYRVQIDE